MAYSEEEITELLWSRLELAAERDLLKAENEELKMLLSYAEDAMMTEYRLRLSVKAGERHD